MWILDGFWEGFGWILGVEMGWTWSRIEVSFWEVILVVFCIDFWCCVVSTWHRRRHECIVNYNTKSMFFILLLLCCLDDLLIVFWLIFDWFWEGFGWILGVEMGWKWGLNEVSFWEVIFVLFCIHFWCCVVSTWHRRRHECTVNCNTNSMFLIFCCCVVWMICWSFSDWFWIDLGGQNDAKINLKMNQKCDQI